MRSPAGPLTALPPMMGLMASTDEAEANVILRRLEILCPEDYADNREVRLVGGTP